MEKDLVETSVAVAVVALPFVVALLMLHEGVRNFLGRTVMGFNPLLVAVASAVAPVVVDKIKEEIVKRVR